MARRYNIDKYLQEKLVGPGLERKKIAEKHFKKIIKPASKKLIQRLKKISGISTFKASPVRIVEESQARRQKGASLVSAIVEIKSPDSDFGVHMELAIMINSIDDNNLGYYGKEICGVIETGETRLPRRINFNLLYETGHYDEPEHMDFRVEKISDNHLESVWDPELGINPDLEIK